MFAEKFKNLTAAQSGPLARVKNAALRFLKSPGGKEDLVSVLQEQLECTSKRI